MKLESPKVGDVAKYWHGGPGPYVDVVVITSVDGDTVRGIHAFAVRDEDRIEPMIEFDQLHVVTEEDEARTLGFGVGPGPGIVLTWKELIAETRRVILRRSAQASKNGS